MLWIHPRKPWLKLRRKVVAALAVMQMGIHDHARIASIVGLTPEEIARIDAAEDKAVRELVLDGIPPGEFFTLAKQIRCPQCGAQLTLAPCVTCRLNSTIKPFAGASRPAASKSPETTLAPQILLVTADVELRWSISQLLEHSGYDVTHCRSPSLLLDEFAFRKSPADVARFDLLICDERLLDETANTALERLSQWQLRPPLVLLSQDGEHVVADVAVRLRASAACARFDLEGQLATVRQIAPLNGSLGQSLRGPPQRMTNEELPTLTDPDPSGTKERHNARSVGNELRR